VHKLHASGFGVVAVTPDTSAILLAFSEAHHLEYPLLSDVGGRVIEAFGLLNPNIPPNPRQAMGQPFPGQFMIAPNGIVLAKAFTGDLRHRISGSALLLDTVGGSDDAAVRKADDIITARLTLSSARLFGGQEIAVAIDVDITEGWHLYGASAPAPYTPLSIEIDADDDLIAQQHFTVPAPTILEFAATGESLPVHQGQVRITGRMRLRWSPPPSIFAGLEDAVRRRAIAPGAYCLGVTLRYQPCSDSTCLAPQLMRFDTRIVIEANVAPTRPG
jgi:AhpC/TSA family